MLENPDARFLGIPAVEDGMASLDEYAKLVLAGWDRNQIRRLMAFRRTRAAAARHGEHINFVRWLYLTGRLQS